MPVFGACLRVHCTAPSPNRTQQPTTFCESRHLQRGGDDPLHEVGLRLPRVQELHRVRPPWDGEDGAVAEVRRELLRVQGGGGDDELQVEGQADWRCPGGARSDPPHVGGGNLARSHGAGDESWGR